MHVKTKQYALKKDTILRAPPAQKVHRIHASAEGASGRKQLDFVLQAPKKIPEIRCPSDQTFIART